MSRWLPAAALGCILALIAIGVVLALRPGPATTDAARGAALAQELRCPDCASLSAADSPTRSAREIRRQIDELIGAGASDAEVRAHFVDRYGQWILLAPSSPAAWLVPLAVVAAGVIGLAWWLVRRPRAPAARRVLSAEEQRRLHDEAEALDA